MKKTILALFFLSQIIIAQYTQHDHDLIKTTFQRDFKNEIIDEYFNSNDPLKIDAALLSVSHSADTNWVERIVKIDFNDNGKLVAFALGQLGPSIKSIDYLEEKIYNPDGCKFLDDCLIALGKIAGDDELKKLKDFYLNGSAKQSKGIYLGFVNFYFRNIRLENNEQELFLSKNFEANISEPELLINQMFAIYRTGLPESLRGNVINLIKNTDKPELNNAKYFAIGALRRSEYFPDDIQLLEYLASHNDLNIRTETAKAAIHYEYKDESELEIYLSLLNDINANVARDAAVAIKNIKVNSDLKSVLKNRLINICEKSESPNVLGELFVSINSLFPEQIFDTAELFEGKIEKNYLFTSLAASKIDLHKNYNILEPYFSKLDNRDSVNIIEPLITLLPDLREDRGYKKILLSFLETGSSPVVYLISTQVDSIFILQNKDEIETIIVSRVESELNNYNFGESLVALAQLSDKISDSLYKKILKQLTASKIVSVSSYAKEELGLENFISKDIANFEDLWSIAFAYKEAIVKTTNGQFKLKFKPEVSPVSVGNFCYLANKNYFDGVRFHRVVANFVIQTGDPTGTGWSGPGYEIVSELSTEPYKRAAAGMASAGKDTEGSQWFVMHSYHPHLDGRYSNFADVIEGMGVVDKIERDCKIITIELIK